MFAPVVPISLVTALNGTSRIRHLRAGATLLPSIATLAEHVLKACLDVADYYGYDYSMGTLEKPTAIDGVEDLIDYVED